jgi:hypothetical protein
MSAARSCPTAQERERISAALVTVFLAKHLDEVHDDALHFLELALVSPEGDIMTAGADAHPVLGFEHPHVLVVPTEESEMIQVGRQDHPAGDSDGVSQRVVVPPGRLRKTHLLPWRPRPHAQRTESTPRVRPSGAASHLGLFEQPNPDYSCT